MLLMKFYPILRALFSCASPCPPVLAFPLTLELRIRIYNAVVSGRSDSNIRFADLKNLIYTLGFVFKGQSGSHAGYYHPGIHARISIQPTKDGKAKPYQVKQLRDIIKFHGL